MKAHWIDDGTTITAEELNAQGIVYQHLSLDPAEYQPVLDVLRTERGYGTQDEVALAPTTPNLDALLQKFDGEHFHDEDEVRFVLDGAGIFDIRSDEDRWMRVEVESQDLIVVPAKRYHRFELTETQTIRCVRMFQDAAGWVPHYRA